VEIWPGVGEGPDAATHLRELVRPLEAHRVVVEAEEQVVVRRH
jgi:hypothetical protein